MFIDREIPAVDQHVALSTDLSHRDVESMDVVGPHPILGLVEHRGKRGQHQIGLSGLASGIRDGVQVATEFGEASSGSPVTVGFRLVAKIGRPDRDMDHVGPEPVEEVDDFSRDLAESDEGFIAPDHRRPKGGIHAFQTFHDGSAKIPASLVGDQQYQPSIVTIGHALSVG